MSTRDDTATLFTEIGLIIKGRMQKALPLPLSQCQTLNFIDEHQHPSMQEVARYFHIRAPSATLLVDELVRAGFVERRASPRDRRKVEVRLTQKGKRLSKTISVRRKNVLDLMFNSLSIDDRRHLNRILEKVISDD